MKKIVWLMLSCLMVVMLVLASCGPAEVEEEEEEAVEEVVVEEEEVVEEVVVEEVVTPTVEEEEEEVVPGEKEMVLDAFGRLVEKPQYGGTITFSFGQTSMENLDPVRSALSGWTAAITYETLIIRDWSRGPAGSGEDGYTMDYCPESFFVGAMAESFELVDLQTIVFQIRHGVHFHDIPPVNGREMTPDDITYTWLRNQSNPLHMHYFSPDWDPAYKSTLIETGPWELTFTIPSPRIGMITDLYWHPVVAFEMVEEYGHLREWQTSCGTGPYYVADWVAASSMTWRKNPNYWMMDPIHPDNLLPYPDELRGLVIPDETTLLAAVRTHKLDRTAVAWDKSPGMMESNPELLYKRMSPTGSQVIFMRTDLEPFSDIKVRQALCLAVDQAEMAQLLYEGNCFINTWPIQPGHTAAYTPIEELPDDIRELWECHPDKARALLADAGYPTGFPTKVNISAGTADAMAVVQGYFAEIGVELEIVIHEGGAMGSLIYSRNYDGMIASYWGNAGLDAAPAAAHGGWAGSPYNFSNVVDDTAAEFLGRFNITLDADERMAMMKEEAVREMALCWEIPLPAPAWYFFWTPWLKGYHGEIGVGPTSEMGANGVWRYVWVDQDLKYQMTGRR